MGVAALLQLAVQSLEWTYSLYWRFSAQQQMLVWGDGFYNGPIKTTKTVQHQQVHVQQPSSSSSSLCADPAAASLIHRTHQLRDLYHSLSTSTCSASALMISPEDLTDSEWFYLLCLSFSFPPGIGLPGNAFASNKHVWITGANQIHTKIFSRAILAKSASIKTVVCIPVMDGVVELGTTDMVEEDMGLIQHIKCIFLETRTQHHESVSTSNSGTWLWEHYNHYYAHSSAAPPDLPEDIRGNSEDSSNSNNNNNDLICWSAGDDGHDHYSTTLSALLLLNQNQNQNQNESSAVSCKSAFSNWSPASTGDPQQTSSRRSQCLLKSILHSVPFLHYSINKTSSTTTVTTVDEEEEEEESLRAIKQLGDKIEDLEAQNRELKEEIRKQRNSVVQVSIIGSELELEDEVEMLLEVQCPYKEGLLLEMLLLLQRLGIETTSSSSSSFTTQNQNQNQNELLFFIAHLRANLNQNTQYARNKPRAISDLKRAIQQIIPSYYPTQML